MRPKGLLVVGECPSLGRCVADLLGAYELETRFVVDIAATGPVTTLAERFGRVIVASTGYWCTTLRRWLAGEMPGVRLIVVGSRDPLLHTAEGVVSFDLPIDAARLITEVRGPPTTEETERNVARSWPDVDEPARPLRTVQFAYAHGGRP